MGCNRTGPPCSGTAEL